MYIIFKTAVSLFLIASIVLFSDKMTAAALNGLNLWLNTALPSLFPFMVIVSWLSFGSRTSKSRFDGIIRRLFGVPSCCMSVFAISFLAGYPMGAKIISNMLKQKKISADTAEHMLSFCNNPGIVFIISAVSSSMLADRRASFYFIAICVLSSLLTGIAYNIFFPCAEKTIHTVSSVCAKPVGIYEALLSAVKSILAVGGCIIFFSAVSAAVNNALPLNGIAGAFINGILEFAGGIDALSSSGYPQRSVYPLIAAILCWGGFSVHLQTAALIDSEEIDIKKYIVCKIFSAAAAYFAAYFTFDMFFAKEVPSVPVFNEMPSSPSMFAASSFLAITVYLYHRKRP